MLDFGSILGGIGAVTSALGGNDTEMVQTQKSGYETLDPKIQKYLMDTIFPRITAWGETPYQTVPLRRISSEDTDPRFGSTSRQWLQQYYDNQRIADMAKNRGVDQQQMTQDPQAMADMEARMVARQYMMGGGASPMETTEQARRRQMYEAGLYDDKGLASIGKYVSGMNQGGGMQSAAALDMVNRNTPEVTKGYGEALMAALMEAQKRKMAGA